MRSIFKVINCRAVAVDNTKVYFVGRLSLNLFRQHSLKTRVTLFTLVVFFLGIWTLAFYVSRMLREDMQRILGDQLFSNASIVAQGIDDEINDKIAALELVAKGIDAKLMAQPTSVQAKMEQRLTLALLFNAGAFVTDMQGMAIASVPSGMARVGTSYREAAHVATALQQGRTNVSRPFIGARLRLPVVSLATPIRDAQGKVIGALVGVTDLSKPNFLDQLTQNRFGKMGGYILVAPKYRLMVTATDRTRVTAAFPPVGANLLFDRYLDGYEGSGSVVDTRGVEVLSAAKRIPSADWVLVVRIPTEEAFAPIFDMQRRTLLFAIFMSLLAGGLSWWMLRWQLAPVTSAVKALTGMSTTDLPKQALPIAHEGEIGDLIRAFNNLLETLGQREQVLRTSERLLKESQRIGGLGSYSLDITTGLWVGSEVLDGLFGLDAAYARSIEGWENLIHPDDRHMMARYFREEVAGRHLLFNKVYRVVRHDDGELRWVHGLGKLEFDDAGRAWQMHGTIQDITERKQSELKLQLAASVFSHAREGIMITDAEGTIIDVNEAFTRISGFSREDAMGRNPSMLRSGQHDQAFYQAMWSDLLSVGYWKGEIWNRRKNGDLYVELIAISAVRGPAANTLQYVALFSDITALKEQQNQLERIAHFDALTNLPNRVLLADRLQQAMAQAQRRGQQLAVAYLDLDGFKGINDRRGHDVGDQVLITLASRMRQALREGDTLARLGGDEFVAVLIDLEDVTASLPMLTRLLAAAAQPVQSGELDLQVSASLGVTFYPQEQDIDPDQLLRQADQAMYQAKLAGKNRYQIFDAAHDSHLRGHHESIEGIRLALKQHEFVLHYQPKVNMRTGAVVGAEALIRWQHPDQGLLAPAVFLPVIENHELAVAVGEWVIDAALSQMEAWQAAGLDLPVSVNIGAHQLQQPDFVDRLRAILTAHPGMDAGNLALEVLETSALEDIAWVSEVIEACAQMGVTFALDDFGTGYSSLTYLKNLRVSLLKIDQSFVRDMLEDPDDLSILRGVIGLAEAFKRQVIAEGVETVAHGTVLLQLGCDIAQGYGIAHPMPGEEMPSWVRRWKPDEAWSELTWLGGEYQGLGDGPVE